MRSERFIDKLCPCVQSKQWNACILGLWHVFGGCRCSDEEGSGKHIFAYQAVEAFDRFIGIVVVIVTDQADLSPVHATTVIYGIQVRFGASYDLLAEKLHWSFDGSAR